MVALSFSVRPKFLMIATAMFVCSACQPRYAETSKPTYNAKSGSESLLDAEGGWQIVENEREVSPLEQHMKARKAVDPNRVSQKNAHTQSVAESHAKEEAHFRVLRLEPQMSGLYGGFDKIETAAGQAPKPVPKATKRSSAKPVLYSRMDGLTVQGVRLGEHPGKTRLVLDVSDKPQFTARFENNQKRLIVDLKDTAWNARAEKSFAKHPLVQSYTTQSNGRGGSQFVLNLKRPGKLVMKTTMKPNPIYNAHRIVLDVAAL